MSNRWHGRGLRRFAIAGICALAALASTAYADDERPPTFRLGSGDATLADGSRPSPKRPAPTPSYASRFASRVQFQMETMSAITQTSVPGQRLQDHFLYEDMSRAVEHSVRRETRRAVRDYLLELTAVDQMVDNFLSRGIGSIGVLGQGDGPGGRRSVDFSFGVSHLRPEVEMEYELGDNKSFKLGVDGRGRVGLRYRDPRLGGNQIGLGFDGDDTFYLDWRIGGF